MPYGQTTQACTILLFYHVLEEIFRGHKGIDCAPCTVIVHGFQKKTSNNFSQAFCLECLNLHLFCLKIFMVGY